jgi:hypothetical protein
MEDDTMKQALAFLSAVLITAFFSMLFVREAAAAPEFHGSAHQHFDARFAHNHYYFDRGYHLAGPPHLGAQIARGPDRFWYDRGQWYRRDGLGWVVVGAPIGAFVSILPPAYSTVYFGGIPYYYANDTYYIWNADRGSYEVVDPPTGIEAQGTTRQPAMDNIFVYPRNGQSTEQQAQDRYECYRSAATQTGFDPTKPDGGVSADEASGKHSDYVRAESACLDARGYSVK